MASPSQAIAYYRVSTDRQEQSVSDQREWARRAGAQHGVTILREFEDVGVPGDEILTRRGLMSLLEHCDRESRAQRPVEALIAWDCDRISRADSFVTGAVMAKLMDSGVRWLLTAEGLIDLESDSDRLLFNVKQDFGRRGYAKSVSRHVARTVQERAAKGRWLGGIPPYAFVIGENGHLALGDPVEADAVRTAFQLYLEGYSLLDVARRLRELGAPLPRRAKAWERSTVYRILTNPVYTGAIHRGRTNRCKYFRVSSKGPSECRTTRTASGKVKVRANAADEVVVCEDAHASIVNKELFDAVQQRLHSNRLTETKKHPRAGWLFGGLCVCGDCGSPMYGWSLSAKRGERRYSWRKYCCSAFMRNGNKGCLPNAVLEDVLLARLVEVIQEHFSDEDRVQQLRKDIARRQATLTKDSRRSIGPLRKRIADLDAKIDQGNENLALLPATRLPGVLAKIDGWEKERQQARDELSAVEQTLDAGAKEEEGIEEALVEMRELAATVQAIKDTDPTRLRRIFTGLVEKVELNFTHPEGAKYRRSIFAGGTIHLRPLLNSSLSLQQRRRR